MVLQLCGASWNLRANGRSRNNLLLRKLAVSIPYTAGTVSFSYIEITDCFQALGSLTRKRGEKKALVALTSQPASPLSRRNRPNGWLHLHSHFPRHTRDLAPFLPPKRHTDQFSQNRSNLRFWCGVEVEPGSHLVCHAIRLSLRFIGLPVAVVSARFKILG